ncbi:MAG TPA: MBL fold metallo-hydrolase, partial [Micromonosporaceae bacterium]
TAITADHDGRRQPGARRFAPALGFVLAGRTRTYFAGDTAAFPGLAEQVGGCDIALLPVGGWGPGLGPGHLTPATAAGLLPALRARHAIPIHYGTFWPIGADRIRPQEFLPPGSAFRDHAAVLAPGCEVHVLAPGQTVDLPYALTPTFAKRAS